VSSDPLAQFRPAQSKAAQSSKTGKKPYETYDRKADHFPIRIFSAYRSPRNRRNPAFSWRRFSVPILTTHSPLFIALWRWRLRAGT
jgi:hypothetical protein